MADLFFGSPLRRLLYARPLAPGWPAPSGAMDWVETPSSHVIKIDVPGLAKDDVKVQVEDGNVLSVRGAAREKEEGVGGGGKEAAAAVWHVAERGRPELAREVALPENVRVDGIRASVDNGVLTVVVPKEPAPARPRPRPVAVSSKL